MLISQCAMIAIGSRLSEQSEYKATRKTNRAKVLQQSAIYASSGTIVKRRATCESSSSNAETLRPLHESPRMTIPGLLWKWRPMLEVSKVECQMSHFMLAPSAQKNRHR